MTKINFDKFIHPFIELSTLHITKADDARLSHDPDPLIVYDMEHGWLIHVSRRRDDPGFWERFAKSAYSPALKSLLMKVETTRIPYLWLNSNAAAHPELPSISW